MKNNIALSILTNGVSTSQFSATPIKKPYSTCRRSRALIQSKRRTTARRLSTSGSGVQLFTRSWANSISIKIRLKDSHTRADMVWSPPTRPSNAKDLRASLERDISNQTARIDRLSTSTIQLDHGNGHRVSKVANTRCLSMFGVADWLCRHGDQVRKHLKVTKPPCDPYAVWWIFLIALRAVAKEANAVFVSLQGLLTMVNQQHDRFVGLVARLCKITGARGQLPISEVDALCSSTNAKCGKFAILLSIAKTQLKELGTFWCL